MSEEVIPLKTKIKTIIIKAEQAFVFCKKTLKKPYFPLICLGILTIIAISDYFITGLVRRTIVFYEDESGLPVVEERFIKRLWSDEKDLRLYIEEALLGSVSFDAAPLLPAGTELESLILRDGTVLAAFSYEEALSSKPVYFGAEGLYGNLESLSRDIKRNFNSIKEVRFFIGGHEVLRA